MPSLLSGMSMARTGPRHAHPPRESMPRAAPQNFPGPTYRYVIGYRTATTAKSGLLLSPGSATAVRRVRRTRKASQEREPDRGTAVGARGPGSRER